MNARYKKSKGKPAKYVIYKGKPVTGLSWSDSIQYYYYSHWRGEGYSKRPLFGSRGCDIEEAVIAYNLWLGKKGSPTITIETKAEEKHVTNLPAYYTDALADVDPKAPYIEKPFEVRSKKEIALPEAELIDALYKLIRKNKSEVEKRLKIKITIENAGCDISLKDVGNNFFNRQKFKNEDELTKAQKNELAVIKKSWQLFQDVIKKNSIGEITKSDIIIYRDYIADIVKKNTWSTTTHKRYYEHIKRVLNFAVRDMDNVEQIITVKTWCLAQLTPPKKVIKFPSRRIKAEDFKAMLKIASIEDRAMLLMAANCAYTQADLGKMPFRVIDLKNKTCVFRRVKNGAHRAAILWDETIEAIEEYLKIVPHNETDPMFICKKHKRNYTGQIFCDRFNALCTTLKLKDYQHKHFRATAESICLTSGLSVPSINSLMGHDQKIKQHYLDPELYPELSKPCSEILHHYYFSQKEAK